MRLPFVADGVDLSPSINKYGYSVSYFKRLGPNSGIMQDGSYQEDVLAYKARIQAETNDLYPDDLAALLQAFTKTYITLTYWDIRTNAERTAEFIPDISASRVAAYGLSGIYWLTSVVITLDER